MNSILRVGTYPTIKHPGRGLHAFQISKYLDFKTYFLTPRINEEKFNTHENCILIEKDFLLQIRPINTNFINKISFNLKRIFSIFNFSLHGLRILLSNKIDIIHIHSPMYILIGLIGFLQKKKIYITFHGTDFHRIKNAKWYFLFRNIFDKVFIISPDMKEILSKIHNSSKVIQVKNGIDLDVFQNFHGKRKKQIIAVGSLKNEKGFKFLIEAFNEMLNENIHLNEYKLIIVGEGLLRYDLNKQIISANMNNNISLIGHLDRSDIINLYNESELFVLSSISEGFPKVVLEAMACGCKIVATNVGSVSQMLDETDFEIIESENVKKLKEALLKTIEKNYINYQNILEIHTWASVGNFYKKEYEK